MAGKNTEYNLAIKIAGAVSSSFNSAMGTATGALANMGRAASTAAKVAGIAIGAATTAMAAFTKSSLDAGMEFDKSMAQVAATMGTSVDQIAELRNLALEMGSKTAFTATEAAEALNYMALAGYDAATQMDMLPTVLNLAAAGGMELASASDMITDSQSALGLNLEQTRVMVDQMAKTASKSNTNVAQLGEAILTVGGTAQYMAGGTEEINTVLGILADNGIKASEGGTHLRNMLLSLSAPTDDAQEVLKQLNVQVFDAEGKMRSFSDIFPELNAAMAGLTDQEKLAAFSTLFNSRDIASATALLNTSTERWDELGSAILDSAGAAEAMAATQLDNLAGDITLWTSALEGAQVAISDKLTPAMREFVQFGTEGLSEITDAFRAGGLSSAMAAFGGILSDGLDMVVGYLPVAMDAGMQLLGALGQGILDNLPTITNAAVEVLVMFAEGIAQATPALILGGFQAIHHLIVGIATALPDLIPLVSEALTEVFWAISDGLAEFDISPLIQGLTDGFSSAPGGMLEAATSLIFNLGRGIAQAAPQVIQIVVDLGLQLLEALTSPELLTGLLQATIDIAMAIADGIINAIPAIIEAAPTIIYNLAQALIQAFPMILSAIAKLVPKAVTAILNIFGGLGDKLANSGVVESIQGVLSAIGNAFSAAWDFIKTVWAVVAPFFQGIWNAIQWIFSAVGSVLGGYFQIAWENIKAVFSVVASYFQTVFNTIAGIFSAVTAVLHGDFAGAWEAIKGVFAGVGEFFQGVWNTIVDLFSSIGTAVGDAISGAVRGAINAVLSGAIGIINGFIGAINTAIDIINAIPGVSIGKLNKLKVPQMAEGGVVTQPTLLEAGEAGNEAIIPLGELWDQMQGWVADAMTAPADWIGDAISAISEHNNGQDPNSGDPPPPIYITYSPVYNFEGEAPSREDLVAAEKVSQAEFERMMNQWLKDNVRKGF